MVTPIIQPSAYAGGNPYLVNNPYLITTQQPQKQQQPQQNNGGISIPNIPSGLFNNGVSTINSIGSTLGFGSTAGSAALTGTTGAGAFLPTTTFGTPALSGALPGLYSATPAAAGVVPGSQLTGALGSSTPLSGVIGPAGIGAVGGGLIAKWTGGNELGGSIGGAAGGAAGGYLAGTATGTAIGAALGLSAQALNFVIPGLGIVIGGLAGSLWSNKKPSDKTMAGGVNLNGGTVNKFYADTQSSTGGKFDDNNAKFRDQMQDSSAAFSKFLLDNGATLKGKDNTLVLVNGSRDGLRYWIRDYVDGKPVDREIKNFGQDFASYSKSLAKDITNEYNIPPALQAELDKMDFSDISHVAGGSNPSVQNQQATYTPPSVAAKRGDNNTFEAFYNNYKNKQVAA